MAGLSFAQTLRLQSLVFGVHPLFDYHYEDWMKVRDVIEGAKAMKSPGKREYYIPKLRSQKDEDYGQYVERAMYFNLPARIQNTNAGILLSKIPEVKYDDSMKDYFVDNAYSKSSFSEIKKFIARELLSVSRVGAVINVDSVTNKPYVVPLYTEQIFNWLKDSDGKVYGVILVNTEDEIDPEKFSYTKVTKYFKHFVDEDGVYKVTEYNDIGNQVETVVPSVQGKTLNYLPVVCSNSMGLSFDPIKPAMRDIAEVAISHLRTSADLELGRHFVGLPQPVVTGGTADNLTIGSPVAWTIPNDKAKAYYLEFQGQGLDGLSNALNEKEAQMSQFSAQLLDTSTRGSEAEGTVMLRYGSDAANLVDMATSIEQMLRFIYSTIAIWSGVPEPEITIGKEFVSTKLSYNDIREFTKACLEGKITDEEYRHILKNGGVKLLDNH